MSYSSQPLGVAALLLNEVASLFIRAIEQMGENASSIAVSGVSNNLRSTLVIRNKIENCPGGVHLWGTCWAKDGVTGLRRGALVYPEASGRKGVVGAAD